MENNMDICRICCQKLQTFPEIPKPTKLFIVQIIFSIHSLGTHQPVGPADFAPLFPMELIMQEVTQDRYVEIPEEVREVDRPSNKDLL